MSRASKLALWLLCGLLISCSTQESHWRSVESPQSGKIEYRGVALSPTAQNGLGGSGKTPFAKPENGLGGTGQQARNGLGGTGSPVDQQQSGKHQNGLGGTGSPVDQQQSDTPQNGLGGTGKQPGKTTIVGSVTAFGSIWVNDRHILLPQNTRYFSDGDHSQRSDLNLGQVVAVLADESGADYQAIEVHSVNNVIGPLTAIHPLANGKIELQIIGQRVIVDNHTRLLDQQQQALTLNRLSAGQWLAVSGLRAPDQSIRASLIRDWPQQTALLAGPVSALEGRFMLGDQSLRFATEQPSLDQPLTLSGELIDNEFVVDDWQPMPLTRLLELADEFWLEGFPMEDAELYLEGFEIQLPEEIEHLDGDHSISIGFEQNDDEFWIDDTDHELEPDYDHQQPDYDPDHNEDGFEQEADIDPEFDEPGFDGPEFDEPELDEQFEYEDEFEPEFEDEPLPEDIYPQED